jgi:hypothetical protein
MSEKHRWVFSSQGYRIFELKLYGHKIGSLEELKEIRDQINKYLDGKHFFDSEDVPKKKIRGEIQEIKLKTIKEIWSDLKKLQYGQILQPGAMAFTFFVDSEDIENVFKKHGIDEKEELFE